MNNPTEDQPSLEILFEDDTLIAINKPSGLLVHLTPLDNQETKSSVRILSSQLGRTLFPVHRLDKPTSGVLLFCKNKSDLREYMDYFALGAVKKEYIALVRGWINEKGTINHPLRKLQDRRGKKLKGDFQEAVTSYELIKKLEFDIPFGEFETTRYSLVSISPKTGRYRQIRRHMKHIFHPIIGDTTFGDGKQNRHFRENFGIRRLMLHAHRLSLNYNNSKLLVESQIPKDFLLQQIHIN